MGTGVLSYCVCHAHYIWITFWRTIINYLFVECFILLSLFLAVLYDVVLYLGTTLRKPVFKVTKEQKRMLGVSDKGHYKYIMPSVGDGYF